MTDQTLQINADNFLFDGAYFWAHDGEIHIRSTDGLNWSGVDLGGRLLRSIDVYSGFYVSSRFDDEQWLHEYSNDLVNWQTINSNRIDQYGEGTATFSGTTLVFATGELRQTGFLHGLMCFMKAAA